MPAAEKSEEKLGDTFKERFPCCRALYLVEALISTIEMSRLIIIAPMQIEAAV